METELSLLFRHRCPQNMTDNYFTYSIAISKKENWVIPEQTECDQVFSECLLLQIVDDDFGLKK